MSDDLIAPTPERLLRDLVEVENGDFKSVELLEKSIKDADGRISQPLHSIDILGALERRNAITPEMWLAGDWFRKRFRAARLDSLQAADMTRPMVSGKRRSLPSGRVEDARNDMWRAVLWVGGFGSPGGSCIWHVLGCEMNLKRWASERGWASRKVSPETATGILIAALGTLAAHYGNNRR
jgi:hypothetical protein